MNQTIQLGQVRPSVLSRAGRIVKNLKTSVAAWMRGKSETFSALCGEDITRKQVIITHAAFILFVAACCLAELFEKGGAKNSLRPDS